eukprot:scaffold34609_cov146-Amphora_coffeaeformis.AAC.14
MVYLCNQLLPVEIYPTAPYSKYLGGALFRRAREGGGTRRAASMFRLVQSHGGECKTVYYGEHGETFAIASIPNAESACSLQQLLRVTWDMDVTIRPMMSPAQFDLQYQNDHSVDTSCGYYPLEKDVVQGRKAVEYEAKLQVPTPMPRTAPSSLALLMI